MKNKITELEKLILELNKEEISYDEINEIIIKNKNISDLLKDITLELRDNSKNIDKLSNNKLVNLFIKTYLNNYGINNKDEIDNSNMNTLQLYFSNIANYKLLTKEEELELARKYKQGDEKAREKLIYSNLRLVVYIANSFYPNNSLTLEDYIQEGNRGLIKAVDRFNPDRDVKFSTYASWWIRQYIINAIDFKSKMINFHSLNTKNQYKNILNTIKEYYDKNGSYPSTDYISEKTGYKNKRILEILSIGNILSLDADLTTDDSSFNFLDTILSDDNIEEDYAKKDENKYIDNIIKNKLTNNSLDYAIIKLKYGFDFNNPLYVKTFGENNDVILSSNYLTGLKINELANRKIADDNKIYLKSEKLNDVNLEFVQNEEHTLEQISNIFNISIERVKQRQYRALNNIKNSLEEDGYKINNNLKKEKKKKRH